jgi:hypothetical protein
MTLEINPIAYLVVVYPQYVLAALALAIIGSITFYLRLVKK